jgi:hypothetical protein
MNDDLDPGAEPVLCCSFCGKSQHEVQKLVAGPKVFICDECIEFSLAIVREDSRSFYLRSPDEYRSLAESSVRNAEAAGIPREQAFAAVGRIWLRLAEGAARETDRRDQG